MKKTILSIISRLAGRRYRSMLACANIAAGTHEGAITKLADAAITTRFLLVTFGTDAAHIAVNGASDNPLGVCTDEAAAAEEPVNVALLGAGAQTVKMVASEAVDAGEEVYSAASGKVSDLPTAAGTYYRVGKALDEATADGDEIEVDPYPPQAVVVSE